MARSKSESDSIKVKFGKQVREFRESLKLTREEFAEKADLSVQNIAKIENGERFVAAASLASIATALGREIKDLFDFGTKRVAPQPTLKKLHLFLGNKSEKDLVLAHDVLTRIFKELK